MNIPMQGDGQPGSGLGLQPMGERKHFPHQQYQYQMGKADPELPRCSDTGIYLLKPAVEPLAVSGSSNLLAHFELEATYNKFCGGKKVKEPLSSFLPDLPGYIDTLGLQDNSSLRALIERPPIVGGKEIQSLSQSLLSSFRLHPGPLPEQYKALYQSIERRRSRHHKKHRIDPNPDKHPNEGEDYEPKKHKKKKHDESNEKKRKKKEKKRKKERERERN